MRHWKSLGLMFVMFSVISLQLAGQRPAAQPPHSAQILFCLFNQEAVASDPDGIHKYSEDLIGSIMPYPADENSVRQLAKHLADRLANAEQTAREGGGKLVPEAAVVKAFNDLMQEIGAPPSVRASEASVREFRQHAASIKAFPALFSADRNGTNCNPGEAVFLLSQLMSNDGVLYEKNLDSEQMLMHTDFQRNRGKQGFAEGGAVGRVTTMMVPDAQRLLSSYLSDHKRNETIALFNNLAGVLGF